MTARLAPFFFGLIVGGYLTFEGGFLATAALTAAQQKSPLVPLSDLSDEAVAQQHAFIHNRQNALALYPLTTWRRQIANAEMIIGLSEEGLGPLQESAAQTKRVLHRTPASPRDWLHLATMQMALDLPVEGAIRYFSTALETGGDLPNLRDNMASIGMMLWQDLSSEMRVQVVDLIRNTWRYGLPSQKRALLQEARNQGLLPLVSLILPNEKQLQRYLRDL